jgi:hypothetical protein
MFLDSRDGSLLSSRATTADLYEDTWSSAKKTGLDPNVQAGPVQERITIVFAQGRQSRAQARSLETNQFPNLLFVDYGLLPAPMRC